MWRLMLGVLATVLMIAANGVAAQVSSGTAFAVAPGLLVTNRHVVAGCSSVEVMVAGSRRTGSVVDADAKIDLALLRVSGIKGSTARLRNPRNVRLGESVMVFGFPLAGSLSSGGNFTSGLISGLHGLGDAAGEIQITAPVQPGNSGGPLLDASGLVVGVVQAKLDALRSAITTGDIPQNVNFAISLEVLAEFLGTNGVAFRNGTPSAHLDTARVAELAQSFTYRIECRGRYKQAAVPPTTPPRIPAPPDVGSELPRAQQGQLPPCPESYNPATWTNCVGTRWYSAPGANYSGEFMDGKAHGKGTFTYADGRRYIGEFKDDKYHGQGTQMTLSGGKYVGEFRDGQRQGRGTLFHRDNSILQSGSWENGFFVESR